MFELTNPYSRAEISSALLKLDRQIAVYLAGMQPETFVKAQGEFWSPAQHTIHLAKSMTPVAWGLRLPKAMIRTLYGSSETETRDLGTIKMAYEKALKNGATAGIYSPFKTLRPSHPPKQQAKNIARFVAADRSLARALSRWMEADLDQYRMPHPSLGKLTIREMLLFTLVHNAHHARRMVERAST